MDSIFCFKNSAALAPMAGCTDSAMRSACRSRGAAFTVSEMISAKALSMNDKKSEALMRFRECERPYGIQLFGSECAAFIPAVQKAAALSPDFIDINMGCPAPKITGSGAGSALMKQPELAAQIIKTACRHAGKIPVSVKMRAGYSEINCLEMAALAERSGAGALIVHPRLRDDMFRGHSDWDLISKVKSVVSIPVIGNGDIASGEEAAAMLSQTGCDGVMIGRAALGNPFIFEEVAAVLSGKSFTPLALGVRLEAIFAQISDMCALKGEARAMPEARKHVMWGIGGFHGAAEYRRRASGLESLSQLRILIDEIINSCE